MTKRPNNVLRIIAGKWRRHHLTFPDALGLRPTPDRIRETVFNWLQTDILGAMCLDAFAGSGALGFEALSRGAKHVTFLDASPHVLSGIRDNAKKLNTSDYTTVLADVPRAVPTLSHAPFDVVFLDPPYRQQCVLPTLQWLLDHALLSDQALIYIEHELPADFEISDAQWQQVKAKHTRHIAYGLYNPKVTAHPRRTPGRQLRGDLR